MTIHPAEFARRSFKLLHTITEKFNSAKDDPDRIENYIHSYDSKVKALLNSRKEWDDRDYLIHNIEAFVIGSIVSMLISLLGILVLEQSEILKLETLAETLRIYIATSIAGGIVWRYIWGPRKLTEEEKSNDLIIELFESPKSLRRQYNRLKALYKPKRTETQQSGSSLYQSSSSNITRDFEGTSSNIDNYGMAGDNSTDLKDLEKIEKAKKNWGLSQEEREERKNILSLRFLMKVSKLKEGSSDEIEVDRPGILVVDPDPQVIQQLTEVLGENFDLMSFTEIEQISKESIENLPHLIITEIHFPDNDKFAVLEKLDEVFDFNRIPVVIYTGDEDLDNLVRARELSIVDFWKKEYDENNTLILDEQNFLGKVSQVLNNTRSVFTRQLDRRIRRKQFQEMNEEDDEKETVKIMVVSIDYLFNSFAQQEFKKNKTEVHIVDNPQNIFSVAISEKPDIILLDENIAPEGIINICKMLNIRLRNGEIILIVNDLLKLEPEIKSKELKILKKFSRPYRFQEVLDFVLNHTGVKAPVESEVKPEEGHE